MEQGTFSYHLGGTGWSIPEWVGTFYKKGSKPDQFLTQYASVFNTVEGNTTFYRVPDEQTIRKWTESVPSQFKFCFKFPKEITHIKRLHNIEHEVLDFVGRFEDVRTKLGPFMIQLPESFGVNELSKLEEVLSIVPKTMSYGVEVRNAAFFDHGKNEHRLNQLLKSYAVDRIYFDTRKLHQTQSTESSIVEAKRKKPKVPIRFDAIGSRPMIRFVGTNDVINNEVLLKEWAIIFADWMREGLRPYMFIHAPDGFSNPALCLYFHKQVQALLSVAELAVWPAQREQQLGLF